MKVQLESIGPAEAKAYLSTVHDLQRKINKKRVEVYAEDMRAGQWKENTDAITFDVKGNLVNGQHRLQAIVESGENIPLVVCRNITEAAFPVMDQGQKRSNRQVLRAYGKLGHGGNAADVANLLAKWPHQNEQCSKIKLCKTFDYYSPYIARDYIGRRLSGYLATLRAVIVLAAHAGEDENKLKRIPVILNSYMPERPEDYTVMAWAKYYERNLKEAAGRNAVFWDSWYIAQRVVRAVVDGQRLTSLRKPQRPYWEPAKIDISQ